MKPSLRKEIFARAVKFAASGKCKDWRDVQEELVEAGYKRAPYLLDGNKIKDILDAQCELARRKRN